MACRALGKGDVPSTHQRYDSCVPTSAKERMHKLETPPVRRNSLRENRRGSSYIRKPLECIYAGTAPDSNALDHGFTSQRNNLFGLRNNTKVHGDRRVYNQCSSAVQNTLERGICVDRVGNKGNKSGWDSIARSLSWDSSEVQGISSNPKKTYVCL